MEDKIPHKHSEVIKAWADGEIIQRKFTNEEWLSICEPSWNEDYEYRVKPKVVVLYANIPNTRTKLTLEQITRDGLEITLLNRPWCSSNLKIYFDEKGNLSKAEVINNET